MGLPESAFSENDGHCTDSEVLDPIYEHFGSIAYDPYASPYGLVRAQTYTMLPENAQQLAGRCLSENPALGLILTGDGNVGDWPLKGVCFGNSPFGRDSFTRCCQKYHEQGTRGVEIIALLPVRTGGAAFQQYISRAKRLKFWRGRMSFLQPASAIAAAEARLSQQRGRPITIKTRPGGAAVFTGEPLFYTETAPFHTALAYWGPRPELFERALPGMWLIRGG